MVRQTVNIRHFFKNVQKRCYSTAQLRLREQLPAIMEMAKEYALNHQHSAFGNMTGNWINSFGVCLYRDGKAVAVANMPTAGVESPIRVTLIEGDQFKRGTQRYDKTYQLRTFDIDGEKYKGTAEQVFYDEEVMNWLRRTSTRQKGFSLRVVSVAEYQKDTARRVLLQLSNVIESKGGNIWQFKLG